MRRTRAQRILFAILGYLRLSTCAHTPQSISDLPQHPEQQYLKPGFVEEIDKALLTQSDGNSRLDGGLYDNGWTTKVQWDNSTLYVDGKKVFIYSGEFHYWRIPVPALYLDIFQKLRATGYNAISIYFHWGFHNPAEGVWDFETGAHNLQPIFDAAKTAGIWVIARPGPYIHAETTAGGLPGWLVQRPGIEVRTNGTLYTKHWKEYIDKIGPIIARNQVGGDRTGTVILAQIENEYYWGGGFKYDGAIEYMKMLSQAYREVGILIPIFHNDVGMARAWLPENYPGSLDLYGLDGYPRGFDCADPTGNFFIRTDYYNYFKRWYPTGPEFTPEFQGGAFDPWGGPGYEKCAEMVGSSFVNVYYKNNIAQRFTMMNFYMAFGGTNWGYLSTPVVYTSYDYGAGISEARLLRDKINEGKLIALFLRTMDPLLHAELIGNTSFPTFGAQYSNNSAVYVTELHNPVTETRFYIIRHGDTNSTDAQPFDLKVNTTRGEQYMPDLMLHSRESKILITSYDAGSLYIVYLTSEIITWQKLGGVETLFFIRDDLSEGEEITFLYNGNGDATVMEYEGTETITTTHKDDLVTLSFTSKPGQDMVAFNFGVFRLAYLTKASAYRLWAPVLQHGPGKVDLQDQVLIQGPYLVRNATADGSSLHLVGDVNEDTTVLLWIAEEFTRVTWNGEALRLGAGPSFSRQATISGPDRGMVKLPNLNSTETKWKIMDSLPEINVAYDDSAWAVARNMNGSHRSHYHASTQVNTDSTRVRYIPVYEAIIIPLPLSDEYYVAGTVIYRGRFNSTQSAGNVTGVHLEVWGGTAFGYSAWLNGKYFTSQPGDANCERFVDDWTFSPDQLQEGENILVVISDSNGYDRDNGVTFFDGHTTKKPRGIKSAKLLGASGLEFASWTLQGNAGGENYDDAVRAPYNEDGLYAERIGAHFPGFDGASWKTGSPMKGFSGPGIKFYRTTINIYFPLDYDVPLAFTFDIPLETKTRVELFVNGYQMGKYVNHIGPQSTFPVYPGIINRGENVIGLAVWGMHDPSSSPSSSSSSSSSSSGSFRFTKLSLDALEVFRAGYGVVDGEGLITGLPRGRDKYHHVIIQGTPWSDGWRGGESLEAKWSVQGIMRSLRDTLHGFF